MNTQILIKENVYIAMFVVEFGPELKQRGYYWERDIEIIGNDNQFNRLIQHN